MESTDDERGVNGSTLHMPDSDDVVPETQVEGFGDDLELDLMSDGANSNALIERARFSKLQNATPEIRLLTKPSSISREASPLPFSFFNPTRPVDTKAGSRAEIKDPQPTLVPPIVDGPEDSHSAEPSIGKRLLLSGIEVSCSHQLEAPMVQSQNPRLSVHREIDTEQADREGSTVPTSVQDTNVLSVVSQEPAKDAPDDAPK